MPGFAMSAHREDVNKGQQSRRRASAGHKSRLLALGRPKCHGERMLSLAIVLCSWPTS